MAKDLIDIVVEHKMLDGCETRKDALMAIKDDIDGKSIYFVAKEYGVLVNNSGEEFAIQYMTDFNELLWSHY